MSGTNSPQGGLTRRSFLKTTAAVAGATALAGGVSLTALADGDVDQPAEDRIAISGCQYSGCESCQTEVVVRDGKVIGNRP